LVHLLYIAQTLAYNPTAFFALWNTVFSCAVASATSRPARPSVSVVRTQWQRTLMYLTFWGALATSSSGTTVNHWRRPLIGGEMGHSEHLRAVEPPKKAPFFESAMPARPGKVWSGMPQVTNLPCTFSVLRAGVNGGRSANGRARCGRRLEDKNGEERERRRDTHFMYESSGDFFVTSAVEMMRSNSSEYGSAKLSPTACTACAAPSLLAFASWSSRHEKAVNSAPSALPKMILWRPSAAR
jgi:hypothetical protein